MQIRCEAGPYGHFLGELLLRHGVLSRFLGGACTWSGKSRARSLVSDVDLGFLGPLVKQVFDTLAA